MIKVKFGYSGKEFTLTPYDTKTEKDIMLATNFGVDDYGSILKMLGIDDESLTEFEQIVLLYKLRSISVGEEIPLSYKCKHCHQPNEALINIEENVITSNITNDKIKDAFKPVNDGNIQEFLNVDVDELDLDEYDVILEVIKESVTKFDFIKESSCMKCREINYIDVSKDVLENMSEDSLSSIYQTYNDLNFYGKYTKQDIDSLYPFERTILIGLLNKTREELNK